VAWWMHNTEVRHTAVALDEKLINFVCRWQAYKMPNNHLNVILSDCLHVDIVY